MTNEEILEKAFLKAKKNCPDFQCEYMLARPVFETCEAISSESDGDCIYTNIFNHKFAKAFFKSEIASWKHHIQQMVLEEEPIQYLAKFL